jgi:hypothetical protein
MKFLAIAIKHLIEHGADPLAIQRFVDEMAREGGSYVPETDPRTYRDSYEADRKRAYRQKAYILNRDGNACRYCGEQIGPFHIDHVVPQSRGGASDKDNLVTSCVNCNLTKGTKTLDELGWKLRPVGDMSHKNGTLGDIKKEGSHTLQEKNNINIYTHAKAKKGTRLPENWQPSLETLSYADKLGCSAAEISAWAEDFRLWAYSASGQVSIKRDWESAFKGWIRREKAKGKPTTWGNKSTGKVVQGSFRKELPPEPPRKPRTAEEQAEIDAKLKALMRVKRP